MGYNSQVILDSDTFTLTMDNGEEIPCEVVFSFYSEEFGKSYVIFLTGEDEEPCVAQYLERDDGSRVITEIDTPEEWEMIIATVDE